MGKKLFLSDEPIEEPAEDAFGHKAFVETLYRCIKDCDCKINVGLFGKWGVGKTSIVKLLIKKLKADNEKIITLFFDAWKYSHGSLPQELVLRLNKEYKIENQDRLETEIYGIQEEEAPPNELGWRSALQRIWHRFKLSIILTPILLGLFMWLFYSGWIPIGLYTSLIFVVLLPIIVNLVIRMDPVISPMSKVKMLPAKFDPGRLENKFEKIVNGIIDKKKADRLVVIIDNLDRCSGQIAIEMLETVKTLMEHDRCVYVFPCDYSALVKHLVLVRKYEESDAGEFLRKFFQTSLTIPPLLAQDLEEFATNLLSGLQIPYSQDVMQVMVNAYMENPRKIKQFLNNLTPQYIAAQEREKVGIFEPGEITDKDGSLAKILIIRQEYPRFYEELDRRTDILEDAEAYFKGAGEVPVYESTRKGPHGKDIFADNPGLEQFLKSTRSVTIEDVLPFLRLNRETYPSTIPNAQELKLQVNRGNSQYVLDNLEELKQEDEKTEYIRQIARQINGEIRAKHYDWAFNGVEILTRVYVRTPTAMRQEIADSLGSYMTLKEIRSHLDKFDYRIVFPIVKDMKKEYRSDILYDYTALLPDKDIDVGLLDEFIEYSDLMPQHAIKNLNNRLIVVYQHNEEEGQEIIRRINSKPEASGRLISGELVAEIESRIGATVTTENRQVVELYLELKARSPVETKLSFLEKVLAIIATNTDSTFDETKQFGVKTLISLETEDIPEGAIDGLHDTLNEFAGRMDQPSLAFSEVFFKFFKMFSESQREGFLHQSLLSLIDSSDAFFATETLKAAMRYDVVVLAYDFVLDKFINRVQTNLPELELVVSIGQNTPPDQKGRVKDMLVSLINNPNAQYCDSGLEGIKELHSLFESSQVGEICQSCLQRGTGTNVPNSEKGKFVTPILEAFEECPTQFQRRFADYTSDFIRNGDPNIRDLGITCYKGIEASIQDDQKEAIVNQLVREMEQRTNQNAIDESSEPILDLISEEQALLGRDDKVRLIDMLLSLRNEAKPKGIRLTGLKYLGKVDKFYHRKKLTKSALEADLQSEDQDIRARAEEVYSSI